MSSSSHFSSGLNNWAGSDKPTRFDFVNDNRILDEGAMWKAAYDASGTVAAAGGIDEYTLSKNTYDSEGFVALAGGIVSFVQQEAHGFTRDCNRATAWVNEGTDTLEITSLEVHEEPVYEVQFIAPERYDINKAVQIDGELMSGIFTLEGNPVPNSAWVEGAPVCITKKGDMAFFKHGSGAGANYDVVGGTTQPAAKENRIWVKTETSIPHFGLFAKKPTANTPCPWFNWTDGDVAIVANGSANGFVAYEGNHGASMSPTLAFQYDKGVWQSIMGEIYHEEQWHAFESGTLFDGGTEFIQWEKQTIKGSGSSSNEMAFNDGQAIVLRTYISPHGTWNTGAMITSEMVELTPYSTLLMEIESVEPINPSEDAQWIGAFSSKSIWAGSATVANALSFSGYTNNGSAIISCDVSSVNRAAYIAVCARKGSGKAQQDVRIKRVWLLGNSGGSEIYGSIPLNSQYTGNLTYIASADKKTITISGGVSGNFYNNNPVIFGNISVVPDITLPAATILVPNAMRRVGYSTWGNAQVGVSIDPDGSIRLMASGDTNAVAYGTFTFTL